MQMYILLSCKSLHELEAVTDRYVQMANIFKGLRSTNCDPHIIQRIKLELLETRSNLLNLQNTLKRTARREEECRAMTQFIKSCRLYEMIDDMLLDIAFQTNVDSKPGASIEQLMTTSGVQKSSIETLQSTGAAATGALKSSPERRVTSKPKLVTNDELALVPSYLRGRITLDKLNETYEMIREVTELKYQLFKKNKKTITTEEREAITRMRAETVPTLKGQRFITVADIKFFKDRMMPKATLTHLSILRSLHRLYEIRDKNVLRIVIAI
ncbi:spindle and kinetochore-associated protein 1-like isoform X2 [Varroa jacobsoni]|uniref:SKA complex subunit 1 n=1 Tax=Varroa destructor TaxID=109461 RepID=A0A7M7MJG9_VARDE|nr:spindle and kinetochore-associated protein 1-like isoform X2 [Varroa destructor]XP_022690911.1 spindle and kinetochore-associated protein 1-like isoform X2 [Varroa jacobsoni]